MPLRVNTKTYQGRGSEGFKKLETYGRMFIKLGLNYRKKRKKKEIKRNELKSLAVGNQAHSVMLNNLIHQVHSHEHLFWPDWI